MYKWGISICTNTLASTHTLTLTLTAHIHTAYIHSYTMASQSCQSKSGDLTNLISASFYEMREVWSSL